MTDFLTHIEADSNFVTPLTCKTLKVDLVQRLSPQLDVMELPKSYVSSPRVLVSRTSVLRPMYLAQNSCSFEANKDRRGPCECRPT